MVSPRIPELKNCGFGVPLRVGAKIIAIIFCLMSSLGLIISLYFIIKCEIDERSPKETDQDSRNNGWKEVIAVMAMLLCTIIGTLAFLLWCGVKQHKSSMVLPWAILTAAFNMIFVIIDLLLFIHSVKEAFILAFVIVVITYCILIVYGHFRELRREKNLPQTLNDADAV